MNIGYLSRLFPFLTLLTLLGCPNFTERDYDYSKVSTEVHESSKNRADKAEQIKEAEDFYKSDEIIEVAEENISISQREENIKTTIKKIDSLNVSLEWKFLKDDLYINKKGQLGLQINFATEVGNTKYYILNFTDNDHSLNKVIDTVSFIHLGSTYYKDKNNIYYYYDMAYGGKFTTYNIVDYDTFHVIGDHYAKDKDYIYGERAGKLTNVDYQTFTSEVGAGPYAKDKFGYYFWNELIMTHDELYKKYKRKSISALEFSELIKN